MRSIGEMARDSGLGVSTLRFYDRAGVLVPARVDPVSGYRWYAGEQVAEARLLARLRRAAMPLADIRLVLAGWSNEDTDLVRGLLQAHLRRLERGLADARGEFSTLRALLDDRENLMASPRTTAGTARLTVPAPNWPPPWTRSASRPAPTRNCRCSTPSCSTRRATGSASWPPTATGWPSRGRAPPGTAAPASGLVPVPLADAMRALLDGKGTAELALDGARITLETGDRQAAGQCLDHAFPDYRRLVRLPAGRRAVVDAPAFREAVRTGPVRTGEARGEDGASHDLSVLGVADDGTVVLCEDDHDGPDGVAVNRAFLLEALTAGARDRLVLELGSPTTPLAVRRPDDEETFSLLMPVRLEN